MDVLIVLLMSLGVLLLIPLLLIFLVFLNTEIGDKLMSSFFFLGLFFAIFVLMHNVAVEYGWIESFINLT